MQCLFAIAILPAYAKAQKNFSCNAIPDQSTAKCSLVSYKDSTLRVKVTGQSMASTAEEIAMAKSLAAVAGGSSDVLGEIPVTSRNAVECIAYSSSGKVGGAWKRYPIGPVNDTVQLQFKNARDIVSVACMIYLR